MEILEQVKYLRESNQVIRCHTLKYIGSYTVGQHIGDCVQLLLKLWPEAPNRLIKALVFHDIAERATGDIPSPVKSNFPVMKEIVKEIESLVDEALEVREELNEEEQRWLLGIDYLELLLWCKDQQALGNTQVEHFIDVLTDLLEQDWVPDPIYSVAQDYNARKLHCGELLCNLKRA
jgi:hypothetical protein